MIEINIRLDQRGQDNSVTAINQREGQALSILGDCLHHRADYLVDGVTVPRLVAGLNNFDSATLHQLALELKQDAIAVFYPDQCRGEFVGPSIEAWGQFDLSRFKRLDEITLYGQFTGFGWDQSDSDRYRAARGLPA
jgi:hypothetical protein